MKRDSWKQAYKVAVDEELSKIPVPPQPDFQSVRGSWKSDVISFLVSGGVSAAIILLARTLPSPLGNLINSELAGQNTLEGLLRIFTG